MPSQLQIDDRISKACKRRRRKQLFKLCAAGKQKEANERRDQWKTTQDHQEYFRGVNRFWTRQCKRVRLNMSSVYEHFFGLEGYDNKYMKQQRMYLFYKGTLSIYDNKEKQQLILLYEQDMICEDDWDASYAVKVVKNGSTIFDASQFMVFFSWDQVMYNLTK